MLSGLIEWSLSNRALVFAMFILMSVGGLYAATQIPVDAVPDLVNIQVQVVTEAGTMSPLEVERYVTYPVELSMSGLPHVEEIRSISRFGISLVTIVFREGTDIMLARQFIQPDNPRIDPPSMGRRGLPDALWGITYIGKGLLGVADLLSERPEGDRMIIMMTDGESSDIIPPQDGPIIARLRAERITLFSIMMTE